MRDGREAYKCQFYKLITTSHSLHTYTQIARPTSPSSLSRQSPSKIISQYWVLVCLLVPNLPSVQTVNWPRSKEFKAVNWNVSWLGRTTEGEISPGHKYTRTILLFKSHNTPTTIHHTHTLAHTNTHCCTHIHVLFSTHYVFLLTTDFALFFLYHFRSAASHSRQIDRTIVREP